MLLLLFMPMMAGAKQVLKPVYLYGIATSFVDSTVYFTDIQHVDSSYVNTSNDFLFQRQEYSRQLRQYLINQGMSEPTCITTYSTDKKKLQKRYLKLRNKYVDSGKFTVKYVDSSEFTYKSVPVDPNTVYVE